MRSVYSFICKKCFYFRLIFLRHLTEKSIKKEILLKFTIANRLEMVTTGLTTTIQEKLLEPRGITALTALPSARLKSTV